jgi:hypothetical protein
MKENNETLMNPPGTRAQHPDGDEHKGAVEDDSPHIHGERATQHGSLTGQIGHRNADEMINGNDTDYPEPGSNPEHSGEHS